MLFSFLSPVTPCMGIAGAVLGVILYLPQIIRAFQTKKTKDIAWGTYFLILINDILWTLYGLGIDNPILYIPNTISICLCITILLQKRKYDDV